MTIKKSYLIIFLLILSCLSGKVFGQTKDCNCDGDQFRVNIHNANAELGLRVGLSNQFNSWNENRKKIKINLMNPSFGIWYTLFTKSQAFNFNIRFDYSIFLNEYKVATPESNFPYDVAELLSDLTGKTHNFDFMLSAAYNFPVKIINPYLEAGGGLSISNTYLSYQTITMNLNEITRFFDVKNQGLVAPVVFAEIGAKVHVSGDIWADFALNYKYYVSDFVDGLSQRSTNRNDSAATIYLGLAYRY